LSIRTNMIYLFDDIEIIAKTDLEHSYKFLSKERLNKIIQYRFEIDKKISAISELLLKYALKKEYDIRGNLYIAYSATGKPFLEGTNNIFFNLSHCREGVACVISDNPIGIDIQNFVDCDMNLLNIVCSSEEITELKNSSDIKNEFIRLWTVKEAYVKCIGEGITEKVCEYNFAKCKESEFTKYGYCFKTVFFKKYSLAVCGNFEGIKIQKVKLDQIM
jgi:4'-phosphopantetheinyl transferase